MQTRRVFTVAAAVLFLGAPTYAALAATPSDQCTALQKQWDQAIATHGNAPAVAKAKAEHDKGVQFCTAGKPADGVRKLELALKNLGVKPQI